MENCLILNKLIILIYIVGLYTKDKFSSDAAITRTVMALLLYLIINLGKAIIPRQRYKNYLKIISLIMVLLCCFFVNNIFIMLVPISVFELLEDKIRSVYLLGIFFVILFLVKVSYTMNLF